MARRHYQLPLSLADGILRANDVPAGHRFRGLTKPDLTELLVVTGQEIAGETELTDQQVQDLADSWGFSKAALDAADIPGLDEAGEHFPNEPAGLTSLAVGPMDVRIPDACEAGVGSEDMSGNPGWLGTWANWQGYPDSSCGNGNTDLIADASAPISPDLYRTRYPFDHPPGSGPVRWTAVQSDSTRLSKMYHCMTHRLLDFHEDGQWEGQGQTKQGFWGVGDTESAANELFPLIIGAGLQSSFTLRFDQQNHNQWQESSSETVVVGKWYRWEFYFELNDIGSANGIFRWWISEWDPGTSDWINMRTIMDFTDRVYRDADNPDGFRQWKWDPTWGGTGGSNKSRDDFVDIAHVRISGEVI